MKILQSSYLPVIGFILATGYNLPHLVEVHPDMNGVPVWYEWVMFIVLDFGILILAINGTKLNVDSFGFRKSVVPAEVFAWFIFILNLYYYYLPLSWLPPGQWLLYIPPLILSAIPAYFVFYFSELISETITERNAKEKERLENVSDQLENVNLKNQIDGLRLENDSLKNENDIATKQNVQLRKYEAVISNLMATPEQISKNMKVTFCKNLHLVGVSNSAKSVNCKKCT